ncbi:hypothetical protein D9758_016670 [Tetrapyrgos nigripes]|uniref:Uncharacterized protein n=1 Tax=Tetrapyrgos nigripes TaxID=182062 RepID=A0A8H5FID7_9AGAR|nr:hypothetical protein D9758_016670 [Tetrapyrgos nigripes]
MPFLPAFSLSLAIHLSSHLPNNLTSTHLSTNASEHRVPSKPTLSLPQLHYELKFERYFSPFLRFCIGTGSMGLWAAPVRGVDPLAQNMLDLDLGLRLMGTDDGETSMRRSQRRIA